MLHISTVVSELLGRLDILRTGSRSETSDCPGHISFEDYSGGDAEPSARESDERRPAVLKRPCHSYSLFAGIGLWRRLRYARGVVATTAFVCSTPLRVVNAGG